ncbi:MULTISPECIES: hypothetical protein [unclassified Bartonella]
MHEGKAENAKANNAPAALPKRWKRLEKQSGPTTRTRLIMFVIIP